MKRQTRPYSSQAINEIALDALNESDLILIKTVNSTYCFLVSDPVRRLGILMGGVVGGAGVAAVALGAEIGKNGQVSGSFAKLYTGARAIFFLRSPDGPRRLVTSAVTRLVQTKAKTTNHSECVPCVSN